MSNIINHVAFRIKDFDWYVRFCEDVLGMTISRTKGEAPKRQIWFGEGIQLMEVLEEPEMIGDIFHHIGLHSDCVSETVEKALALGCREVEGKPHWFELPNGVFVELK